MLIVSRLQLHNTGGIQCSLLGTIYAHSISVYCKVILLLLSIYQINASNQ